MIKDNMEFIKDCLFRIFVIASLVWYQVYAADPKDNKVNQESFFSIAAIAGIVIGSLVGAITLIAATCCIVCYCVVKRKEDSNLV